MYFLDTVKSKIVKEVNAVLKKTGTIAFTDLVYPQISEQGDLSLPCFTLSKTLGKNPSEIAKELATKLDGKVCKVMAVGPYLNFVLNKAVLSEQVLGEVAKKGKKFGQQKIGAKKKVLVEFANQNTHKEVHVGHVRNFAYGDSVCRLLKINGFEAMPFSYINDFGINTARVIWGLEKLYPAYAKASAGKEKVTGDKSEFLGKLYPEATKKMEELGDIAKKEVGEYMKAIESRSGDIYTKWQETRQWNTDGFNKIYKELGIKFVAQWYESEFIDEGMRLVQELKARGVLKESQGAVIADLEQYDLGVQVYLRADGTALYPVADLALARAKVEKFDIDESIIVVDARQSLHFKQLFKVMELLGYQQKMVHLGYDFVTLPDGAMSSRKGNVVTYTTLKKALLKTALTSTREKHADWEEKKIKKVAKLIAYGAMKFEMIKVAKEKTITFDIANSLRFDGFTSAYLQYTGARINSILRKATPLSFRTQRSGDPESSDVKKTGENLERFRIALPAGRQESWMISVDFSKLTEQKEHDLVLKLAKYPEVVLVAGENYDPSEIAKYLFELAQLFNDYYHAVPVLKAEQEVMEARLTLLASVKQVLANGFNLLGINFIEEM